MELAAAEEGVCWRINTKTPKVKYTWHDVHSRGIGRILQGRRMAEYYGDETLTRTETRLLQCASEYFK